MTSITSLTPDQLTKINQVIEKFFHEHRVAWDELVRISRLENRKEKTSQALTLFNTELKPHFETEEATLLNTTEFPQFASDPERIQIIADHQEAYKLIANLEKPNIPDQEQDQLLNRFFPLMKSHIKLEDPYFSTVKRVLNADFSEKTENKLNPLIFVILGLLAIALLVYAFRKTT
jgi:hemerythrin